MRFFVCFSFWLRVLD